MIFRLSILLAVLHGSAPGTTGANRFDGFESRGGSHDILNGRISDLGGNEDLDSATAAALPPPPSAALVVDKDLISTTSGDQHGGGNLRRPDPDRDPVAHTMTGAEADPSRGGSGIVDVLVVPRTSEDEAGSLALLAVTGNSVAVVPNEGDERSDKSGIADATTSSHDAPEPAVVADMGQVLSSVGIDDWDNVDVTEEFPEDMTSEFMDGEISMPNKHGGNGTGRVLYSAFTGGQATYKSSFTSTLWDESNWYACGFEVTLDKGFDNNLATLKLKRCHIEQWCWQRSDLSLYSMDGPGGIGPFDLKKESCPENKFINGVRTHINYDIEFYFFELYDTYLAHYTAFEFQCVDRNFEGPEWITLFDLKKSSFATPPDMINSESFLSGFKLDWRFFNFRYYGFNGNVYPFQMKPIWSPVTRQSSPPPSCTNIQRPGLNYMNKGKDYAYCSTPGNHFEHQTWAREYFDGTLATFNTEGDTDRSIFTSIRCEFSEIEDGTKLRLWMYSLREVSGGKFLYRFIGDYGKKLPLWMTPNVQFDQSPANSLGLGSCNAMKSQWAYMDAGGIQSNWDSYSDPMVGGLYMRNSQYLRIKSTLTANPVNVMLTHNLGLTDVCNFDTNDYYAMNYGLVLKATKVEIPTTVFSHLLPEFEDDIKAYFRFTHTLRKRKDAKNASDIKKSRACHGDGKASSDRCTEVEPTLDNAQTNEFYIGARDSNSAITFLNFPNTGNNQYYVEISDMEIRYQCPPGSAAIMETKPVCKCNSGLTNLRTKTMYVKNDGMDKCSYKPIPMETAGWSTKGEIIVHQDSNLPAGTKKFRFNLYQKSGNAGRIEVYPLHGSIYERDQLLNKWYTFNGLLPGRRYNVEIIPLDEYNKELSSGGEESFVTHCSCIGNYWGWKDDIRKIPDLTGSPKDPSVTQKRGLISFSFIPNSRCEEAYALTRVASKSGAVPDTFSRDFPFLPSKRCQADNITLQDVDDLTKSLLPVGETFVYCARATAVDYLHDRSDALAPSLPSSNVACVNHQIRWEASIDGKVTLDPSAGALPVKGVQIFWALHDAARIGRIASGYASTGDGGKFKIEVNANVAGLDNNVDYPMSVQFKKNSGMMYASIKHNFSHFSCGLGQDNCPDGVIWTYLRHLDFDEPMLVYDTTSVPFAGRVIVADTGIPGCFLQDVDVCLVDVNSNGVGSMESGMCTKTNSRGEYSIGGTIGMRVRPTVSYKNHTFESLDWRRSAEYNKGVLLEAGKSYQNNDFKDVTKASLLVEVAGGLCDLAMGHSSIELTIAGGCTWTRTLIQSSVRSKYMVPAHRVNLRLSNLVNKKNETLNVVLDALREQIETIDLREIPQSVENNSAKVQDTSLPTPEALESSGTATAMDQNSEEKDLAESKRLVRFQYDGTLKTTFSVTPDTSEDCTESYSKECNSFHVAESAKILKFTVKLRYDIVGASCDIVPDDLKTEYINFLGLSEEDKKNWPDYNSLEEQDIALLQACSQESNGCNVPIMHDVKNTTDGREQKSNARVEFAVITGPPNPIENYLKYLDFYVDGTLFHKACVLITGDYTIKDAGSVPLPTYKPLLVIRDPPGGLSYASYQNVQTSMSFQNIRLAGTTSYKLKYAASLEFDDTTDVCSGAGFGAIFLGCRNAAEVGLDSEFSAGLEGSLNLYDNTWSDTRGFVTTWSYQTSDDQFLAGRQSDAFVVPNLNVKYSEVREISFNNSVCKASKKDMTKFNLESKANKPTLSFLTIHHIEENVIPSYENLIDNTKEKIEKKEDEERNKNALAELQEGLKNWIQNLAEHTQTNADAETGKLKKKKVQNWFDVMKTKKVVSLNPFNAEWEPEYPDDHFNSIIPEYMYDSAQPVGNRSNLLALKETNQIEFNGGSSVFEFGMSLNGYDDKAEILPAHRGETTAGMESKVLAKGKYFNVGGKTGVDTGFSVTFEHELSTGHSKEVESSVSFVLGDPDDTNYFVVAIYVDPKYGTFVFNTVGGLSSCPHEDGTDYAAKTEIELENSPKMKVLPDEHMVFQLKLKNTGLAGDDLELVPDNTANSGMLALFVNGGPFTSAQVYQGFEPLSSFTTTLAIMRGPIAFRYPPLKVTLRDSCGSEESSVELYNKIDSEGRWIEFEQKCLEVRWAGALRDEQSFSINKVDSKNGLLQITLFNPAYQQYSFASAVNVTRLESVQLYYRDVGNHRWYDAQTMDSKGDLKSLDFADFKEDDYGYVTASWAYSESGLLDGKYELKVQTNCEEIASAPIEFNKFSDSIITGVIDRLPPKPYGSPTPRGGTPLWPGEEVAFLFTEAISCEQPFKFSFQVKVDGLLDGVTKKQAVFGNDNLNVLCEQRKIAFTFDEKMKYSNLVGKEVQVELHNVTDLVGNVMNYPLYYQATHAEMNLAATGASFMFTLDDSNCSNPLPSDVVETTKLSISSLLGMKDPSRLAISEIVCDTDVVKLLTFKVEIIAPKQTRHLSSTVDDDGTGGDDNDDSYSNDADYLSAVHLAELLIDQVHGTAAVDVEKSGRLVGRITHLIVHLSEEDKVKKNEDLAKHHTNYPSEWFVGTGETAEGHNMNTPFVQSQLNETSTSLFELKKHLEAMRANLTQENVLDLSQKKGSEEIHHQQLLEHVKRAQREGEQKQQQLLEQQQQKQQQSLERQQQFFERKFEQLLFIGGSVVVVLFAFVFISFLFILRITNRGQEKEQSKGRQHTSIPCV